MKRLPIVLLLLLCSGLLTLGRAEVASGAGQCLILNQIYAAGGSDPSTPNRSYVELLNRCSTPVSLAGTFLHTLNTSNGAGPSISLSGSLGGGRFYLAAFGSAGTGTALPTPDASSASALPNPGKAFVSTVASNPGSCPSGPSLVDLVGYGTSSSPCFEGTGAAAAPLDSSPARRRSCADSDDNAADFVVDASPAPLDPPSPRNSSTMSPLCNESSAPCAIISEVYGPGGGGGAAYNRSFIEVLNRCDVKISLDFVRLGVEPSDNSYVSAFPLKGLLQSVTYYLIGFGNSGSGAVLPAPDGDNFDVLPYPGKAFLATDPLFDVASGACPSGASLLDLVGFGAGQTNPCFEAAVAPLPSAPESIKRFRCVDTNNNAADFTVGAPTPRNIASGPLVGGCSGNPTAARAISLAAARIGRTVVVRWQTASELGIAGFNVYRALGDRRVKLNGKPIAAGHGPGGHAYSFADRTASKAPARYWLEELRLDGRRSWRGPARVARAPQTGA